MKVPQSGHIGGLTGDDESPDPMLGIDVLLLPYRRERYGVSQSPTPGSGTLPVMGKS